jgi:hypothetical protein
MPRLPEQNQTSNVILFMKSDIKPASNIVYLTNNKTILGSFSTNGVQKISLPAGNYDFEFWSSESAAYHLDAKLRSDTDTCINIGIIDSDGKSQDDGPFLRSTAAKYKAEVIECLF